MILTLTIKCIKIIMMKTLVLRIFLTVFVMVKVASAASIFAYTSSPDSWIGLGKTDLFQEPEKNFVLSAGVDNGLHLFVCNSSDWINFDYWNLHFTAFASKQFEVGKIYEGIRPIGVITGEKSQMEFSGSGRGNNTLSGFFQIHEVEYFGNQITKIALDFTQYDGGQVNKWNKGNIRINSSVPLTLPIPEPSIIGLLVFSSLTLVRRKR
jgi:hypothetical protein